MTKEQFLTCRRSAPTDYDEENLHYVFYSNKDICVHEIIKTHSPCIGEYTTFKFLFSARSFIDLKQGLTFR